MTSITSRLVVSAIKPSRLDLVRQAGNDGHGNQLAPFAATGQGEPLRCCLRFAKSREAIMLISYAPFEHASVWTEVGPVYVHAEPCNGWVDNGHLPGQLSRGPRVLRTYTSEKTMNYAHNTVVTDESDIEPIVARLLGEADVAIVHVRTLAPQCFLYEVTAQN